MITLCFFFENQAPDRSGE